MAVAQDVILPTISSNVVTAPASTLTNCQPGVSEESPLNLPISDRILGTATAWRAKIGEIAVTSEADEGLDSKNSRKRLVRLICITTGMAFITVLMMVL